MRVAIFGGSFDPIHIGHVDIVQKALDSLDIDKLFIVPTYLNPFKNKFYLQPKQRKNLIEKVFKNHKKIEICDYEIKQEKAVYSIQTVKYIKNLYKPSKIFILIGADNLENLNKWYKIEELKELAQFVIATRKGFKIDNKEFKTLEINIDISSTFLRENLDLNYIPEQIKKDVTNLIKINKG